MKLAIVVSAGRLCASLARSDTAPRFPVSLRHATSVRPAQWARHAAARRPAGWWRPEAFRRAVLAAALWGLFLTGGCMRAAGARPELADERAENIARRDALPSILWVNAQLGSGTAFACFAPGVACTAKHVVGDATTVTVTTSAGKSGTARVLNTHPLDDVAILDIRELGEPLPRPLPVSPLDPPPEGVVVCRFGPPMQGVPAPFLRCDPTAGILQEYAKRNDGTTLPRLIHLGLGFKGDSGSPLFDPVTGMVVGIHVAEENGGGRGATTSSIADAFEPLRKSEPWAAKCFEPAQRGIAGRSLRLGCASLTEAEKRHLFIGLGARLAAHGRRGEAYAAFSEALALAPGDGAMWLWRSLAFPSSHGAREDAAYAFRLSPALRATAALEAALAQGQARPSLVRQALRLRDEVAPVGAKLATIISSAGCGSCPAFCERVRKADKVRLFEAQGANHPTGEAWLRGRAGRAAAGHTTLLAIDERVSAGCGDLAP